MHKRALQERNALYRRYSIAFSRENEVMTNGNYNFLTVGLLGNWSVIWERFAAGMVHASVKLQVHAALKLL